MVPIVFGVYIASSAAEPSVVFNTELLQLAGVGISVGSLSANVGKIEIRKRKQIVPICFMLGNKLHVCVCVCVGFCGFQRFVSFFAPSLTQISYQISVFSTREKSCRDYFFLL